MMRRVTSSLKTTRWSSDHGGGLIFVVLLMPALLAMVALAYDGGQVFVARREMNKVANAAGRAGANFVEEDSLYAGGVPELRPGFRGVVDDFARAAGAERARANPLGDQFIEVYTFTTVRPFFRSALDFAPVEIEGHAVVRVRSAVEEDDWE